MPNVYEVITSRIIKQLEGGTAPWHKPWKARGKSGLPRNLVSGREYRGINVWTLLSSGYANPQWLTFRQARQLDGHVRQGEVGFPIVYWKFGRREVQDEDEIMEKRSVLCLYYTVFNIEQCDGLKFRPAEPAENQPQLQPIEACEQIVADWRGKPVIKHGGDSASYSKVLDSVQMPERTCFDSLEEYYSTLFHELSHSTGHPARLNRSTLTDFERFGDHNYSREELVAELGAAFLAGYCGIENRTINNSAAYLANWLKALKDNSRMVLVAASQAQKAADLILGVTPSDAAQQNAG
jgi:antirestriction protein ArdC